MGLVNRTILLIEDDDVDAQVVRRVLKDLGVLNKLEVKKDSADSLEYLSSHIGNLPSLILVDINMPKTSGIEFISLIKRDPQYKKIPIVVITTSKAETDILQAYEAGAAGYLIKDVDYHEFVKTCDKIISYWNACELP